MIASAPASKTRYLVLAVLTATQIGSSLLSQGIGSLMPFIARALSLNKIQIGLIAGVMGVSWIVISPLAGVIVDRFGERRVILWSGLVMSVVLVVSAAFENYLWLLAWLVPYALLMCFQTPAGGRAIMQWFTRDRALAMGIRQMGVPVGGFLGALVLAPIAARAGYRTSFLAAAVMVLLTTLLIFALRGHPERDAPVHRFRSLWKRMRTIARDRRCLLISIAQMDHSAGQACMLSFLTISLIATAHFDLASALIAFVLCQLGSISGRLIWGVLSDYLWDGDRMMPTIIACVIGSLAALVIAFRYPEPVAAVKLLLYAAAFLLGFSISGCNGIFAMAQTEVAGLEYAGSALGVSAARSSVAMALAPPLFGALAEALGYTASWFALSALLACGLVPALAARRLLQGGAAGPSN